MKNSPKKEKYKKRTKKELEKMVDIYYKNKAIKLAKKHKNDISVEGEGVIDILINIIKFIKKWFFKLQEVSKMPENKKWIKKAIKHPGALHKVLNVPEGKKIPAKKLAKASKSKSPKIRKEVALAKTLKKMHKK